MLGSDNMTPQSVQLLTIKDASYRLVVFKCSLELAQCHVGGGTAVISLNVIFVYLQGLRSVSQGITIALCAQVRQAAIAVVDGIGWIEVHGL